MKIALSLLLLALETSCTTLANRRDLYMPEPSPDLNRTVRTTTTTTSSSNEGEEAIPPPQYRY